MKIFILEDNIEDRNSLKKIILSNNLGFLAGETNDTSVAIDEIVEIKPDLIIIDLLEKDYNRLNLVQEIEKKGIKAHFLVISNPKSKEIVEKAYRYGIDYFIYKPINDFEVLTIIKRIKDKIIIDEKIRKIYQLIGDISQYNNEVYNSRDWEIDISNILLKLGIIGENGSEDIVRIAKYVIENKINLNYISIRDICSKFTNNPKIMEQKMRRAINMAMTNIASLGIEDYMNDTFVEYSNTLFNFEQIKKEMDYLRGKSYEKGSINMKRFISGLCTICENNNNILRNL